TRSGKPCSGASATRRERGLQARGLSESRRAGRREQAPRTRMPAQRLSATDSASWFETPGFARLLTMRREKNALILRSPAQPGVSKDEGIHRNRRHSITPPVPEQCAARAAAHRSGGGGRTTT